MSILNLVHINVHVTDLERSIAFYEKLGWKVMFDLVSVEPVSSEAFDRFVEEHEAEIRRLRETY